MDLTVDEVMERVEFDTNGGCWLWSGAVSSGYGVITRGWKRYLVHRFMLAHKIGSEIPERMWACHHCDVRACVNPDHLYVGSPADNVWDTHARKRTPKMSESPITHHFLSRADYVAHIGHWGELCEREQADKADAIFKMLAVTYKGRDLIREAAGSEHLQSWMKRILLERANEIVAERAAKALERQNKRRAVNHGG